MNGRGNHAIGILRSTRYHRVQLKQEYQRPLSVASMIRPGGLACQMAKRLGSWDPLGYQSSAEYTSIVNYEIAMPEQFHLRRCDHYRSLGTGCQNFGVHQSADPHQLLWLKGPAVVVREADLGHGVLLRAAPLIRGHRREQQVQLAVDKSSGVG